MKHEPRSGGNLVVSASSSMELAGDVAYEFVEAKFDGGVDVFHVHLEGFRTGLVNLLKTVDQSLGLGLGDDAGFAEHPSMGNAANNILLPKVEIGMDRLSKTIHEIGS